MAWNAIEVEAFENDSRIKMSKLRQSVALTNIFFHHNSEQIATYVFTGSLHIEDELKYGRSLLVWYELIKSRA